MGLHKKDKNRPCQFFDMQTLKYYIETNRDSLAKSAMVEWRYRFAIDYPNLPNRTLNKQLSIFGRR